MWLLLDGGPWQPQKLPVLTETHTADYSIPIASALPLWYFCQNGFCRRHFRYTPKAVKNPSRLSRQVSGSSHRELARKASKIASKPPPCEVGVQG